MSIDNQIYERKIPSSRKRYVGIEIEFLTPGGTQGALAEAICEKKLQWNIDLGSDSSVRDIDFVPKYKTKLHPYPSYFGETIQLCINENAKGIGREIRILALEKEAPEIIEDVCSILQKFKAKINSTCGVHVHLDMRDRDHEKVYNNLFMFQNIMFKMQPKDRHNNQYCKKLSKVLKNPSERHYSINKLSYSKHKTIEVRLHDGCIEAKELKRWVFFLMQIANIKETLTKQVSNIDNTELSTRVKNYVNERIRSIKNKTG